MKESLERLFKRKEKTDNIEEIRERVAKSIKQEQEFKKKKEPCNPKLAIVNSDDLTIDDLRIYEKYEKETWTEADFQIYTDKLSKELEDLGKKGKKKDENFQSTNSRDSFRDWLAERAQIRFGKESSEAEREKDNY